MTKAYFSIQKEINMLVGTHDTLTHPKLSRSLVHQNCFIILVLILHRAGWCHSVFVFSNLQSLKVPITFALQFAVFSKPRYVIKHVHWCRLMDLCRGSQIFCKIYSIKMVSNWLLKGMLLVKFC